jgi:hypothetical protein
VNKKKQSEKRLEEEEEEVSGSDWHWFKNRFLINYKIYIGMYSLEIDLRARTSRKILALGRRFLTYDS